ncbi:serpin-ZX [Tanacetum coccineum]
MRSTLIQEGSVLRLEVTVVLHLYLQDSSIPPSVIFLCFHSLAKMPVFMAVVGIPPWVLSKPIVDTPAPESLADWKNFGIYLSLCDSTCWIQLNPSNVASRWKLDVEIYEEFVVLVFVVVLVVDGGGVSQRPSDTTCSQNLKQWLQEQKFVCSPLSLDIILGMLAVGAEGRTLEQLLEFLGHESIDKFLAKSPNKKVEPVLSSYQKVLETIYKTKASSIDFRNKRDEAVDVINSWVNKETKGLIRFIVENSDLDQESVMLIANAMYFKGIWSNPFDADDTTNKNFHLINREQVSVPFMTSDKRFGYDSFDDCKMIKLPYKSDKGKSNKFSMYIFLPHEKAGLKKLLQNFHSNDALFHGKFDLTRQKFDELWIPKFKISCKFEAKDVMKQMGLTLPFEEKNKELSGIVEPDGFFEKQKLTGPNFINWYRQPRIVLSIEDKLNYLEQPLPPAPVAPEGQLVAPEITAAHTA